MASKRSSGGEMKTVTSFKPPSWNCITTTLTDQGMKPSDLWHGYLAKIYTETRSRWNVAMAPVTLTRDGVPETTVR